MPTDPFQLFDGSGAGRRAEFRRLGEEFARRQQYMPGVGFMQTPAGEVLSPPANPPAFIGCRLEAAADQHVSAGNQVGDGLYLAWAAPAVQFEEYSFDAGPFWAVGDPTALTAPQAGYYLLNVGFFCAPVLPALGYLSITAVLGYPPSIDAAVGLFVTPLIPATDGQSSDNIIGTATTVLQLAQGEQVQLLFITTNANGVTVFTGSAGSSDTWASLVFLSGLTGGQPGGGGGGSGGGGGGTPSGPAGGSLGGNYPDPTIPIIDGGDLLMGPDDTIIDGGDIDAGTDQTIIDGGEW